MSTTDHVFQDPNPSYWEDYTNLQKVKHSIIQRYLSGWFNIMATRNERILYFDTHAGRGKHASGEFGSPLVALQALLSHGLKDRILANCEVIFFFVERDGANLLALQQEIAALGQLPEKVKVCPIEGDCFGVLSDIVIDLRARDAQLAPAFFFIDPYGFSIPGKVLHELMSFPKVELFLNLIWRELDAQMYQQDKAGVCKNIDELFMGQEWREITGIADHDERAQRAVNLLRQKIGATWATYLLMMRNHSAIRYILLHLSNHDKGRDLIKDCLWSICPQACTEGSFFARKSEDYRQMQLLSADPDLSDLRAWCEAKLRERPRRWQNLINYLRPELWKESHLNQTIREMRREGIIMPEDYRGKFSGKANPLLRLST